MKHGISIRQNRRVKGEARKLEGCGCGKNFVEISKIHMPERRRSETDYEAREQTSHFVPLKQTS
jgi:hypothetical protein